MPRASVKTVCCSPSRCVKQPKVTSWWQGSGGCAPASWPRCPQGLRDILVLWDCTQAEAAKRLGMAQPTLANKLRLLQLTGDQRQFVLDNNLTERHARAVLRLPENRRSEALINIAKRRLNARQTDLYIEQLLNSTAKGRHRISMVRDVRIFVNTIDHAIRLMTDNGVPATAHREEKDGYIEYTVRIPTAAAEK